MPRIVYQHVDPPEFSDSRGYGFAIKPLVWGGDVQRNI